MIDARITGNVRPHRGEEGTVIDQTHWGAAVLVDWDHSDGPTWIPTAHILIND
jgi:hypothetical protein